MNRRTYLVRTGTYRVVLIYSTVPPCTALYRYVLFTPSTYRVRTIFTLYVPSTYLSKTVCTEYVLSTESMRKVLCSFLYQISFISRRYIPCTYWFWLSTYFEFLILLRACRALPVCFASDSGTGPYIEPTHTKALAGLFTAAWQQPCLGAWALALAACWGIQLWRVSFVRHDAAMVSCLLTHSSSPSQQRSARCKLACEGLGPQVGASMMS